MSLCIIKNTNLSEGKLQEIRLTPMKVVYRNLDPRLTFTNS